MAGRGWLSALCAALALALIAGACVDPGNPDPVGDESAEGGTGDGDSGGDQGASGGIEPEPGPPVDFDARFEDGECRFEIPEGYQPRCGTVTVPMDWATGEGRVDLAVAVFPATGSDPTADPVIYLEGGPGGHSLETVEFAIETLLAPAGERSDLILFDQRGAGLSEPRLECGEVAEFSRLVEDSPNLTGDETEAMFHDALARCRTRLIDRDVDLADFNSINNAHDVEAIRQALGYGPWNLLGVSYGTKLGLEVMRRHPDSVRAAVLDSVYPPQVDSVRENPSTFLESYRRVVAACRAEPACGQDGDLMDRIRAVVDRYERDPVVVEVVDSFTDETDDVHLTGEVVSDVVTDALYSPFLFTDLPELVAELEVGETAAVEAFLSRDRSTERFFTDGMFFAIACQEEISFAVPDEVAEAVPEDPFGLNPTFELGANTGFSAFATCDAFPAGSSPPSANEAVVSDVPTLLMAGEFDPVTPVSWAQAAAATLSRSHLVVAARDSHGISASDCGIGIVFDFLDAPEAPPDADCLDDQELSFLAPSEPELEPVDFVDGMSGLDISTVRPTDWTVGTLGGDQYRRDSFLDPTQFFQLVGDEVVVELLVEFLTEQGALELSDPVALGPGDVVGPIRGGDLARRWSHRTAADDTVVIDWFESRLGTDTGEGGRSESGDQPALAFVIVVSTAVERDANLAEIVEPALEAITVTSG